MVASVFHARLAAQTDLIKKPEGNDGAQNSLVFQVKEKYFEDEYNSKSFSIRTWKSKGLSNQSPSISDMVDTVNDIRMSKPIRPAYVKLNHKRSFLVQKNPKMS